MATFDRRRPPEFCQGYLRALNDMDYRFKRSHDHTVVVATVQEDLRYFDEESLEQSAVSEMLQMQGCAEAWVDLQSFCMEAQVGWNKKVLDCWLALRQQVVSAHMMAQP